MRMTLSVAALAAIALTGCAPEMAVVPSPEPTTAAPSPSVSPSPTATPTVEPTPPAPSPITSAEPPAPAATSAKPGTTATPTSTPTRTATTGTTVAAWRDAGSEATSADAAASLAGVPDSFRSYVASIMGGADSDGCTTNYVGVQSVHPDGFIIGTEGSDCGGGQTIWAESGGSWNRLFILQSAPLCEELASAGVPTGGGLQCLDGEVFRGY